MAEPLGLGPLKDAQEAAEKAGDSYMAVDRGAWISPQFDVVRKPQVGDKVSRAYNGDSYIVGTIVKISKTMKKITCSNGDVSTVAARPAAGKSREAASA